MIHFAASIVVPIRCADPLAYYRNNTVNSRALIETAVEAAGCAISSSPRRPPSTAIPSACPVREEDPTMPMSPYGCSKLMTEIMLRDAGTAHGLRYAVLRYFNVAGADPEGRSRPIDQRRNPSHQGRGRNRAWATSEDRGFGTDYPTPDGTCIRDYIHVIGSRARASRCACLSAAGGELSPSIAAMAAASPCSK